MNEVAFQEEDRYMINVLVNGQKVGSIVKAFGTAQVCLLGKNVTKYKGKEAEKKAKEWLASVLKEISAKECVNKLDNEPAMMPHEILQDLNIRRVIQ